MTVRRLNIYEVIEIQWLGGIENFHSVLSERDDFISDVPDIHRMTLTSL